MAAISSFAQFGEPVSTAWRARVGCTRFDNLVNNAGIGLHAPFTETTEAQFDALDDAHLAWPSGTSFSVSGGQLL